MTRQILESNGMKTSQQTWTAEKGTCNRLCHEIHRIPQHFEINKLTLIVHFNVAANTDLKYMRK